MRRFLVSAVVAPIAIASSALCLAAPLSAQSLFANRGLGLLLQPQSARSAGLGSVAFGLPGAEVTWDNPAGAVGLPAAGLLVSFQYDALQGTVGGHGFDGGTARFPLIQAAFPFGERWALTAGFGSLLDQSWGLERNDTILVDSDTVAVVDRLAGDGGVSRLRLAGAFGVLPQLSVGAGVDVFTGGVRRTSGRLFPGETQPQCCRSEFRYSGLGLMASVDLDPSEALSLSVSASSGGTLTARSDSVAEALQYDLPVQLSAAGSARVSANALVAVSGEWAGWSSLDGRLTDVGGARDSWAARAGVEWEGVQAFGRPVPLRVGARQQALPFRWSADADWATERAVTGGLGAVLGGGAASTDLAVERGWRGGEAAGLDESFWRILISVTVLGR